MYTIDKTPLPEILMNFRFSLNAFNANGEEVDWIKDYTSKIIESDKGITLKIFLSTEIGKLGIEGIINFLNTIKYIDIIHNNEQDEGILVTSYTIKELLKWEIVSESDGDDFLFMTLDFSAIPASLRREGIA